VSLSPVIDLPTIDFPTVQVGAGRAGASPETMASAVGVNSINSTSSRGSTSITPQVDLGRNIDAAAQVVPDTRSSSGPA